MRFCRALIAALCAAAFIWVAAAQNAKPVPAPPAQPIPFSHKVHAGGELKLECKTCHPNPAPGEMMKIVAPSACMQCHATIATERPAIQKLAAFAKNGREIRWARVYEIPSYVTFSHGAHLAAKKTCEQCHGPVTERDQLFRETDISMGGCMDCHRADKASVECTYCHEPQQPQPD